MPEPVEGKMRFENGKWQIFWDGAWVTLTDAEQQRMNQESGLTAIPEPITAPISPTTGKPTGPPAGPGTSRDGNQPPPGPPAGPRGEADPGPMPPAWTGPWPPTKWVNRGEKSKTYPFESVPTEVIDWDKVRAAQASARKEGWELQGTPPQWVKKEEEQEEPPPTREEVERFLLQEGLWDTYEAVPDPKTRGGWTYREKKVAPPAKVPAPVATEPQVWTDPDTGVRYVETSPGRWDEQTRPPVTKESVASSIEQLIVQALQAERWDLALAYRDFRDAPTDAEKAQTAFDMAMRFSESTVNFDTLKTAFDFFMGPGASESLGISAGQPPPVFGPSGQPLTQEQLSMGKTPVPLFPPSPPGGPQFPGFGRPSTATTGGAFGQPRNVEADMIAELNALAQKLQASEAGTGPDLTPEEVDRMRQLQKLIQASKAGPPQFPAEFATEAEMERSRQEAQAAQDREVIDIFAPYNYPDVDIGGRTFSITDPVARYWLTLNPSQQQALLDSGWEPTPGKLPEGLVAPPITSFARNQQDYWGQPGGRTSQIISEFPSPGIQVNKPGATVRFNTPEEQLALAKANQELLKQGKFGPAGLYTEGAALEEEKYRFESQGLAKEPEGPWESQEQYESQQKAWAARPFKNYKEWRKYKGLGPEPHELFQQSQFERLRGLQRPAKKQFTPRTRVFV